MAVEVFMPRLDMTTEEMTILRWFKSEGEPVKKGEPLLEVMTEKVAIEVEAPADGVVSGIRYQADAVVPVGELIAYIRQEGEAEVPGPQAAETATAVSAAAPERKVRAAPAVRRLAAQLGVDLQQVRGTGPGGRVLAADVRAYAEAMAADGAPQPAPGPAVHAATPAPERPAPELPAPQPAVPQPVVPEPTVAAPAAPAAADEGRPLSGVRRVIAQRMQSSWQTAPHVTLFMDVDMSAAAAFRAHMQRALAAENPDVKFTWNSLITWMAVQALLRRPELNATLEDSRIRSYDRVNLGVAVDTPSGLVVPVVPAADRMRPGQLAAALADVTARAREGRLQPSELTGGTFTVTNLGIFGIGGFTPILNPPQVAILGVGAVTDRVVAVDGRPEVRPVCSFSLSFDHRALDGADGARYLATLQELLQDPYRVVV